ARRSSVLYPRLGPVRGSTSVSNGRAQVTRGVAPFLRRRRVVVLSVLALAAAITLVAGRSAPRAPEQFSAQSSAISSNALSAAARSPHRLHASGLRAKRARKGHQPKRTVRHPRELFLKKAHSKVFDVRKLRGKVVKRERPEVGQPLSEHAGNAAAPAAALPKIVTQRDIAAASAPAPGADASFDGLDFANWGAGHPPDTNGDVGQTYYVETVNTSIGIYNKSSGVRVAAFTFNSFMSQGAFGNLCDTDNFGDPVVLYDTYENRWFITDFAFKLDGSGNVVNPPGSFQCFAVSKTGDPVNGGWNFYSTNITDFLQDYPKFGVWPDGLYMSANMFGFRANGTFQDSRVWSFNLTQMEAGAASPQLVRFDANPAYFTLLPSNARVQAGTPPAGTPDLFASLGNVTNSVQVWKFHVDWANTANS